MVYLHEDKKRFMEAINIVVHSSGIAFEVIEKDYYVTLLLRGLSERLPYIVFKGGTSLSKCHKVIRRFSEDIDIAIDTSISFSGAEEEIEENIGGGDRGTRSKDSQFGGNQKPQKL